MDNEKKFLIKFLPSGRSIKVPPGYNLKQAILDAGLHIDSSCGGVGTCGKCVVQVKEGKVSSKRTKFIKEEKAGEGYVLSCQAKVTSGLVIDISEKKKAKARIAEGRYKGVSSEELADVQIKPWIIKETIKVKEPSISSGTSDLFRLKKSISEKLDIRDCMVPIGIIRKLPRRLRAQNWEVTVTVDTENDTLIDIRAGSTGKKIYGLAIDIGTTSMVIYLVDLKKGKIIGTASEYNPQIRFGEDIINRIVYANRKGGLKTLREAVIDAINSLVSGLLHSSGIDPGSIVSVMIAGNPTMLHLFYGVPPRYIREEPYVTVANQFSNSTAAEVNIKHIKNAIVYSIQGTASYLGADIASGVLASGMSKAKELALFVDLGTNGELVVGNSEWMMGCSCSAGPAFEGGGVKCGIRAVDGAIEKISIDQDTFKAGVDIIGGARAKGICGSGLIDVIGEMYLKGIINRKGRFNRDIGNKFLKCDKDGCKYILIGKKESGTGKDIFISEVDIDNLIRAKAAVYAGIKTLLEEVDLHIDDLEKVYLAGGLGKHLNIRNAVVIGMLPDIDLGKYHFLGNTSITGAYLSLLSRDMYRESSEIANHITYLELSVNMKFMDRYVAGLFLPNTDMKDFPTVEEYLYTQ